MIRFLGLASLVVGLGLLAAPAQADVAAGQTLFRAGGRNTPACGPCHDPVQATDAIPGTARLPGQQAIYLTMQLKAFRANARQDRVMGPAVQAMTDQEIADVAGYLAGLKAPHRTSRERLTPDQTTRAAQIFLAGLPSRGVPACAGCHGLHGGGAGFVPMIAAQDSTYAAGRMRLFESLRGPAAANPMHDVAVKLGPGDSALMATYLSTLRP